MSEKVLSIHYDDPHPVHKAWFEEVGERKRLEIGHDPSITNILRYALKAREVPECDVLICEGSVALRTGVVKKLFNPGLKLVRLVADQDLYEIAEGKRSGTEHRITHSFLDGVIANSEFMKEYAEDFTGLDVEVVHPFVPNLEEFLDFENEYTERKEICFVGYNYPNKNVESLVEAVRGTDYKLHIVGKGHDEREQENVEVHGFVENLTKIYSQCDLYAQPSDGEAFGVAPLEAMAAEIPAIVTDTTGLKTTVQEIDEELVAETSVEGLRKTIERFYNKEIEERKSISQEAREKASEFTEEKSLQNFRNAVESIVLR